MANELSSTLCSSIDKFSLLFATALDFYIFPRPNKIINIPRRRRIRFNPAARPERHATALYQKDQTISTAQSTTLGTGGYVQNVRYSEFLKLVSQRKVDRVTFNTEGTQLIGQLAPPKVRRRLFSVFRKKHLYSNDTNRKIQPTQIRINHLPNDPALLDMLTDYNVDISVSTFTTRYSKSWNIISSVFKKLLMPLSIFAGVFFLFRKSVNSSSPLAMARMKPLFNFYPKTNITFDDVAGCDGAKQELAEVVDFLLQSEAYTENGCIIPRGVLLHGPPGTGKTLLAKAVAGEAGVPFVSMSGSEFVELYVGVGASRVRELFFQAKKNAPCIVFIDEIDAVGRERGAGYAGGNDEREQTINQILVELDGFDGNTGVITLAATNRLDVLDEALLRPGRFDRKVAVDLPDVHGRTRILAVHSRGKPLEPDVDLAAISRRTPGFSGAELENLLNEAALAAARESKLTIGWREVDGALDRLMVGVEKRGGTTYLSQKQKELVAYHEAGHAVCGALIPEYDQVQKITIIPRSNGAGGLTFFSPQESRLELGMYSKHYLESQLVVALGGRVAEEVIFGEDLVTIGASNDLDHVAEVARKMVKEWGMSNVLGPIALSSSNKDAPFMGRALGLRQRTMWGPKLMSLVDGEVERLVNNAYMKAKTILMENIDLLHHLAYTLVEQEVVTLEELQHMVLNFDGKMSDFNVMGDDKYREKLPFQHFPENI